MTTPLQLRADVIAGIASAVPGFKVVSRADGVINDDEIRRLGVSVPACLVAVLAWPKVDLRGGGARAVHADVSMAAYIVTKDVAAVAAAGGNPAQAAIPRADLALTLAAAVHHAVVRGGDGTSPPWGNADASQPKRTQAGNLHSTKLHAQGVCLWAVTWTQPAKLDPTTSGELDDFDLAHIDWQLQPNVHPDDPADPPADVIDASDDVTLTTEDP